ncbi:MAG: hypothetical protein MOIL_01780 [Candidatus Methanolliviera sp. GoM_oil]|nr:MAG: hypothetical protein MOIL_01780 [Candidatus Methanolliviera sp. GoM_oil]
MSISDIKKLDNLTVLKIGLSAVERLRNESGKERDADLAEICYRELCKRRKEEKDKTQRLLYDAPYGELREVLRRSEARGNSQIAKACSNEILWRWRLKDIGYLVERKTALQKLDEILSD